MKVRVIKSKQNNHYLIETMYVGGMIQPFQDSTHVEVTTQVKTSSTMEEIGHSPKIQCSLICNDKASFLNV